MMRATFFLMLGSFSVLSLAQISTDFSELSAGPVTAGILNSATTGGGWYLNTGRGAAFEIQEDDSGNQALLGEDLTGNDGTITLVAVTAYAGREVDLTTHDAAFDFTVGTRRTGSNKGLRYQFLNQAGDAVIANLDWLHNGNELVLNDGAENAQRMGIGSEGFASSFLGSWDSTSSQVREVSVTFSGTLVTVTFGSRSLTSSYLNEASDLGRIRVTTIGSSAAARGAFLGDVSLSSTPAEMIDSGPVLEWNATGPGDPDRLYQEANWIDPVTGLIPSIFTIDPDVELDRSLVIRSGIIGGSEGSVGSLFLGAGDLTINGATLRLNEVAGSSINMGSGSKELSMLNAKVFTQAVAGGNVTMSGYSDLTLYGSDPLNSGTKVELKSPNCFVYFLNKLPSEVNASELSKFSVNGVAASGSNVLVTQYYNGAVLRPKLGGDQIMKGFDGDNLTGTKWNFGTGFKGRVGLGLIAHNAGIYNVDGWGADIWGPSDECRFTYRDQTGDSEIIAKVAWVENTNTWAKGGVMMRADLSAGSPNVFVFQRPDKQITFQYRSEAGGATVSRGPVGGTGAVKWVRLMREGNEFSGYYSTNSASGPWTQVGTTVTINLPNTVKLGIAATSHNGKERGRTNFHEVSTVPASSTSNFGIFTDSVDIEADWWIDNQLSSFLLKKGYMVTLSTEGGGQGFSKFYAATEADLTVNLPVELNNKVSFMRILPWRWIAARGWSGSRADHQSLARTYWNYEWEPTGNSRTDHEFVPMIKGSGQNREFRWEEVRARGGQTHFLGFNEPELEDQGDLTVDEAIALWPKAQQNGLRLGSPARTDGNLGRNWLREFMEKAEDKGYRVDYICVHNYQTTNATQLKNFLDDVFEEYGLPVWLTEFQRDNGGNPSVADHTEYLEEVIPMLERLDYLERYAYFDFNTGGVTSATATLFSTNPLALNGNGEAYGGSDNPSKPAYQNLDQSAWATASLDLENGSSIQVSNGGMITASASIDPSKINKVEFFVNGVFTGDDSSEPYELPIESLGSGLQSIYSVVTTNFGETVISSTSQVFVMGDDSLILSLEEDGELTWPATPGVIYILESSSDLLNWDEMERRIATSVEEVASNPNWATEPIRFYRVRRE